MGPRSRRLVGAIAIASLAGACAGELLVAGGRGDGARDEQRDHGGRTERADHRHPSL